MYNVTYGVLNNNSDKLAPIPKLSAAKVLLYTDIAKITTMDKEYENKSTPKGTVKEEARNALIVKTLSLAGNLSAYAHDKGDSELKTKVNVSDSGLHGMRDADLQTKAENVFDLATLHSADLIDYGVTAADLTGYRARIDAFVASLTYIGTGMAERSGSRSALTACFAEVDTLLVNTIDNLMEGFREKDPELYSEYWAARVIRDMGGSHTKESTTGATTAAASANGSSAVESTSGSSATSSSSALPK
jgi:hypothetical protein